MKGKTGLIILLFMVFVLAFSFEPIKAPVLKFDLKVEVIDASTNLSIEGATVLVQGAEFRMDKTDEDGIAVFTELSGGYYNVTAFFKGYSSSFVTFTLDEDKVFKLSLERRYLANIESCNDEISRQDTFLVSEDVYVKGCGYEPSAAYEIYVVKDVITWTDGMDIPSRVAGTISTVTTTSYGCLLAELVWDAPVIGTYDIVVDVDGDGVFDKYEDALDNGDIEVTAGFSVAHEYPVVPPVVETCDDASSIKDKFSLMEGVYVKGCKYAPLTTYNIYVVEDVATWTDGMPIPPRVSGSASTVTTASDGCIAPRPTLVWDAPMIGKYDILVDVLENGVYDEDVDALDDNDIEVTAGFFIIPELPMGTILGLATCIAALGLYRSKRIDFRF